MLPSAGESISVTDLRFFRLKTKIPIDDYQHFHWCIIWSPSVVYWIKIHCVIFFLPLIFLIYPPPAPKIILQHSTRIDRKCYNIIHERRLEKHKQEMMISFLGVNLSLFLWLFVMFACGQCNVVTLVPGCVTDNKKFVMRTLTVGVRDGHIQELLIFEKRQLNSFRKSDQERSKLKCQRKLLLSMGLGYDLSNRFSLLIDLIIALYVFLILRPVTSTLKWVRFFCNHGYDFWFPHLFVPYLFYFCLSVFSNFLQKICNAITVQDRRYSTNIMPSVDEAFRVYPQCALGKI